MLCLFGYLAVASGLSRFIHYFTSYSLLYFNAIIVFSANKLLYAIFFNQILLLFIIISLVITNKKTPNYVSFTDYKSLKQLMNFGL
jgi:hypothetical protein